MNTATKKIQGISALLLTLFASQTICWKSQGHYIISRIAYDILQKDAPQALQSATSMLNVLRIANPNLTDAEQNYTFVESSSFADLIKYSGGAFQSDWHFVNIPFVDQPNKTLSNYPLFRVRKENVTEAIIGLVNWLQNKEGYQNHFVYPDVMKKVTNEQEGKSYALRLLIHFMGDIHQPLHSIARINDQNPSGDSGGNAFDIPYTKEADNLHSVWDSAIYQFYRNDKVPYTDKLWNTLGNTTNTLRTKWNITCSDYENNDVNQWAKDSYELAKLAYQGATENLTLSADYISRNNPITQRQMVLAGLRLAHLIKITFETSTQILAQTLQSSDNIRIQLKAQNSISDQYGYDNSKFDMESGELTGLSAWDFNCNSKVSNNYFPQIEQKSSGFLK
eukprot:403373110